MQKQGSTKRGDNSGQILFLDFIRKVLVFFEFVLDRKISLNRAALHVLKNEVECFFLPLIQLRPEVFFDALSDRLPWFFEHFITYVCAANSLLIPRLLARRGG